MASSLEIQASEASIERIEEFIKKLLSTLSEEEIDISVLERAGKFNEEFIAPISRTTRTFIERKDEKTVRIITTLALRMGTDVSRSYGYLHSTRQRTALTIHADCSPHLSTWSSVL